VSDWIKKIN